MSHPMLRAEGGQILLSAVSKELLEIIRLRLHF